MELFNPDSVAMEKEIERHRLELNELGQALGPLHADVLAKSQLLDELILRHMVAQKKGKKPTT